MPYLRLLRQDRRQIPALPNSFGLRDVRARLLQIIKIIAKARYGTEDWNLPAPDQSNPGPPQPRSSPMPGTPGPASDSLGGT